MTRFRLLGHHIRQYSTAASSSLPSEIASQFLSHHVSNPPQTATQVLDANQLRLFSLTLSRPHLSPSIPLDLRNSAPPSGTPLPPPYHLAYFTPAQLPSALGPDGTDTSYNPPAPFTRRMWAGGAMRFTRGNPLRVGQTVRETTEVLDCRAKKVRKTQEDMLVVMVRKRFANGEGMAVEDTREWVFRRGVEPAGFPDPEAGMKKAREEEMEEGRREKLSAGRAGNVVDEEKGQRPRGKGWHLVQTPETLFRFSALTFNAHRIHYDPEWCQSVEGHRERVVHGPLNLVAMADFWRDELAATTASGQEELAEIKYRATSPVYVGEGYTVREGGDGTKEEEREKGVTRVEVVSDDGTMCMWGTFEGS